MCTDEPLYNELQDSSRVMDCMVQWWFFIPVHLRSPELVFVRVAEIVMRAALLERDRYYQLMSAKDKKWEIIKNNQFAQASGVNGLVNGEIILSYALRQNCSIQ